MTSIPFEITADQHERIKRNAELAGMTPEDYMARWFQHYVDEWVEHHSRALVDKIVVGGD